MQLVTRVILLKGFDLDQILLMIMLLVTMAVWTMALAEDNFKFIIIVKDDRIHFKDRYRHQAHRARYDNGSYAFDPNQSSIKFQVKQLKIQLI